MEMETGRSPCLAVPLAVAMLREARFLRNKCASSSSRQRRQSRRQRQRRRRQQPVSPSHYNLCSRSSRISVYMAVTPLPSHSTAAYYALPPLAGCASSSSLAALLALLPHLLLSLWLWVCLLLPCLLCLLLISYSLAGSTFSFSPSLAGSAFSLSPPALLALLPLSSLPPCVLLLLLLLLPAPSLQLNLLFSLTSSSPAPPPFVSTSFSPAPYAYLLLPLTFTFLSPPSSTSSTAFSVRLGNRRA